MTTVGKLLVRLGLENKQYQKGIGESQRAAERMAKGLEKSLGGASGKFAALGDSIASRLTPILGSRLAGAAGAAVKGIGSVVAVIGTLTATAAVATAAIGGLVAGITAGAFALAKAAVPTDGIRRAFEGLTSTIEGGSSRMLAALQEATAGMVSSTDLMRSFNLAAQLVGVQFAEQLPDAMQYLGKVSLATGADMNWLLDSLARGVGRLSPLILDNLGVTVNLSQAYQDWAAANNRTVDSMSKAEQQAAVMAQVIDKLRQNTANMPSIVGTAAQVWGQFSTSLRGIKTQMGTDLLPTFTDLLATLQRFMPALQAFASGFTGTFVAVVNVGKSFVRGFARALGIDFDAIANNSRSWGENIVLQLAQGMANAISAVIQVLNQLGQVIASWLQPGSPPKILPDIDTWGTQTAQEWLNGFTAADVSVLRDLSGMVENFLRSLPTEALGGANIAQTILDFRAAIESALAGGGNVVTALPQQLQGYASAFIAVQQAAEGVAGANERLAAAQARVNAVSQQYSAILDPLRAQLASFNAEIAADARSDRRGVLDAIIAEAKANGDMEAVKRAERELSMLAIEEQIALVEQQEAAATAAAQSEVDAAQEAVDAAEEQQRQAEEQLRIQQDLIQHQMETNRLLQEMTGNLEGVGGAAGSAGSALSDIFGGGEDEEGGGLFSKIGDGISALAQQIIDEFEPVVKAANDLGTTWGGVFSSMKDILEEKLNGTKPAFNFIKKMLSGDLPSALGMLRGIWDQEWGALGIMVDAFVTRATINFNSLKDQAGQITLALANEAAQNFLNLQTQVGEITLTILNNATTNFENLRTQVGGIALALADNVAGKFLDMQTRVGGHVVTLVTDALTNFNSLSSQLDDILITLAGRFTSFISDAIDPLRGGLDGIRGALKSVVTWLGNLATAIANMDLSAIAELIGHSPAPLETSIRGIANAMNLLSRSSLPTLQAAMNKTEPPVWAMAADGAMGPVFGGGRLATAGMGQETAVTVQFGDVHINNGTDQQEFMRQVERAVLAALRKR